MSTKKQTSLAKLDTHVDDFRNALTAGLDGFARAGEIYVRVLDDAPDLAAAMRKRCEDIVPPSKWSIFEKIGRKSTHPRMLMGGLSDQRKNTAVQRLSPSEQARALEGGRFELLTEDGDILHVDMHEATPAQVEQLCGSDHVRTLSEQKAWIVERQRLEAEAAKRMQEREARTQKRPQGLPYEIRGGKLYLNRSDRPLVLSRRELQRILLEM